MIKRNTESDRTAIATGPHGRSQMSARDPRSEDRISKSEPVLLASVDQPLATENTRTQNISSNGARVITQRVWPPGSLVFVQSVRADFCARGRVVYWRSFSSSRFAIGLEFVAQTGNWPTQN
jgi:hypothetical protein